MNLSSIERVQAAIAGAAMARDRGEPDVALIYCAVADRTLLALAEETKQLQAQSDAIRKELARRSGGELFAGARVGDAP